MGQNFSGLRVYFGNMESRENIISRNAMCVSCSSGNSNERNLRRNVPDSEGAASSTLNNGTRKLNQHFETIYSNCSENPVEENGNTVTSPDCAAVKCLSESELENIPQSVEDQTLCKRVRDSPKTVVQSTGKKSRNKLLRPNKECSTKKKKSNLWVKFNCARLNKASSSCSSIGTETDIPEPNLGCNNCVCTGYRRTEEHHLGAGVVFGAKSCDSIDQNCEVNANEESTSFDDGERNAITVKAVADALVDITKVNQEEYPVEDDEEKARLERAREIAEGVEPPPGFRPVRGRLTLDELALLFQTHFGINSAAFSALSQLDMSLCPIVQHVVHTQVDYVHCLVPDLLQITSCSYYWGKMDRYEAERLLEGRPEGTFLLRDSAQEEFLFSVSFRKYGRSLHARIEQWNHQYSFDSHDPGVFASPTVCGLIDHYKDPSCCMFFEPTLTIPLHRNFPFPLQHLCRSVICSKVTYDGVNQLHLPKALKVYLKEYHYKQRVRVRRFDSEQ